MILLDFFSGSHGHFLEYVINTYIYRGPKVEKIFTELGASHGIKADNNYQQSRVVRAEHYSEFNKLIDGIPDQVIRITCDTDMENICYQLNVLCRAGDIPADKKAQYLGLDVLSSQAKFRMNHYSKFSFNTNGYQLPTCWRWEDVDHYKFPMRSLYNVLDFYNELNQLSKFLNYSFEPGPDLMKIWKEFYNKNQGVQAWNKCSQILQQVLSNDSAEIEITVAEQAILNWMLTKSANIHDGQLFDNDDYPTNTSDIWQRIDYHLKTFDNRF
jgi:hypothetical protein